MCLRNFQCVSFVNLDDSILTHVLVFTDCNVNDESHVMSDGKDRYLLDSFLRKAELRSIKVQIPDANLRTPSSYSSFQRKAESSSSNVLQDTNQARNRYTQPSFDVHAYPFIPSGSQEPVVKTRVLQFSNIPATMNGMTITNICGVSLPMNSSFISNLF